MPYKVTIASVIVKLLSKKDRIQTLPAFCVGNWSPVYSTEDIPAVSVAGEPPLMCHLLFVSGGAEGGISVSYEPEEDEALGVALSQVRDSPQLKGVLPTGVYTEHWNMNVFLL